MITAEKNIPIPETKYRKSKYPFATMEVGESFAVPGYTRELHQRMSGTSYQYRCGYKKFTIRRDGDSVRVWRLPDEVMPPQTELEKRRAARRQERIQWHRDNDPAYSVFD